MKAFWLVFIKLYQKQLLLPKLIKIGGGFWFSELWPRISNVTVKVMTLPIFNPVYQSLSPPLMKLRCQYTNDKLNSRRSNPCTSNTVTTTVSSILGT